LDLEIELFQNNFFSLNLINLINLFQPLLRPHRSATGETKVLLKAPPPPLHVVRLGPTNHLLKSLQGLWGGLEVIIAL
jgi:hypothetical protein